MTDQKDKPTSPWTYGLIMIGIIRPIVRGKLDAVDIVCIIIAIVILVGYFLFRNNKSAQDELKDMEDKDNNEDG